MEYQKSRSPIVNNFLEKLLADDHYRCQRCGAEGHILRHRTLGNRPISLSDCIQAVREMRQQIIDDNGFVLCTKCRGAESLLQLPEPLVVLEQSDGQAT